MNNKDIAIKVKTQIILDEIDNLDKYNKLMSINVRGDKLESYMDTINKNIKKLKNETEIFYNNHVNDNKGG